MNKEEIIKILEKYSDLTILNGLRYRSVDESDFDYIADEIVKKLNIHSVSNC